MLTKFSVSNFKSFNTKFTLDLSNPNAYAFNNDSVKNGVIQHSIIYGQNGVGKSNLGLAIFDIVGHLTDLNSNETKYDNYLNALNGSSYAEFQYDFLINSHKVTYIYRKTNHKTTISEHFFIDDEKLISIDRSVKDKAFVNLKGTENLQAILYNGKLSILKYIKNNSILNVDDDNNKTFTEFFMFIEKMLFFRSLQTNMYIGLEIGNYGVQEDIIKNKNITNLENFLNKAGIECTLVQSKNLNQDIIAFDFNGHKIPIWDIASTGARSLILFYFWLQKLKRNATFSFVFIDEFDAFYHHKLSAIVIEELKKVNLQFILTTHNTSIISNDILRPDCYFLMKKDEIKSLAKRTDKELRAAHNIEKMYKAGSFDGK